MVNIRVEVLNEPVELNLCTSEAEVSSTGVTVVLGEHSRIATEVSDEGPATVTLTIAPGYSDECSGYFVDGEYLGDAETIEVTRTRARVIYVPVPCED